MKKIISLIIFRIIGWKIVGDTNYPDKCMVIAAPHTSNWDFLIGRCSAYINDIKPKYLIKSELFLPIIGSILKWDGGIPVYRKSKNNVVDQLTEKYNNSDKFILGITPEGTRKRVEKWKSGFYHIAVKSRIPILLIKMDYENKEIGLICEFMPSGNFEEDMLFIQEKYKNIRGKIIENYNPYIY